MYTYDDSFCYLGRDDLKAQAFKYKKILKEKIDCLAQDSSFHTPFYSVLYPKDEQPNYLKQYYDVACEIRENFSHVVVISMGGATLNPESVLNLITKNSSINIHFLNSTDPIAFKSLIDSLDLAQTAFLTISNSGETLETIALVGIILSEFERLKISSYNNNFYFITNLKDSTLYKLATSLNAKIFPHATEISGRYSSFTNITILVGFIANLDMYDFVAGGNEIFKKFWHDKEHSPPSQAAIAVMVANKSILVNLGYLKKFSVYLDWYSQIIAESLGKNFKGFTPLKSLAPNDHHSMFQLYLDGPQDKLFTMFYVKKIDENVKDFKVINNELLGDLASYPLEKISDIIFHSALNSFKEHKKLIRTIILDDLSARSVGALVAHSIIEVIMIAQLLEVNPFDQPAVESIKTCAKQLILKERI